MPISLIEGLPRSGKSYNTVARIIVPALKQGRTVITNIPLTAECDALGGEVVRLDAHQRDMKKIADLLFDDDDCTVATKYAGAVFVLDEFSMLLPSGIRQDKIPLKVKAFFAMHGHTAKDGIATEIVVITQVYTQINAYVTGLVETSYKCVKKDLGFKKSFNLSIYNGAGRSAIFNRVERHFYDESNYKYYKSQTLNDSLNASEQTIDDAGSLLKLPALKWGAFVLFIAIPVLIFYSIRSFKDITHSNDNPDVKSVDSSNSDLVVKSVKTITYSDNNIAGYKIYLSSAYSVGKRSFVVLVARKDGAGDLRLKPDDLLGLGYKLRPLGQSYIAYSDAVSFVVPPLPDDVPTDRYPVSSDVAGVVQSAN